MYQGKTVSVALATYQERKSISKVIKDFFQTGFVDEIVVVNNNAENGTDQEVKKTNARLVYESRQGYAYAFQKAILESNGDYVVVCEPDGTFLASDLEKFLIYAKDFDVVLGTRTRNINLLSGAAMGYGRKFANVLEAKTIEFLFNTLTLTDVGCTYKLFGRQALNQIAPLWQIKASPLFNTELILLTVSQKLKFVEIPITYTERIGKSAIVGNWYQSLKWAVVIQLFILWFWMKWLVLKNKDFKTS